VSFGHSDLDQQQQMAQFKSKSISNDWARIEAAYGHLLSNPVRRKIWRVTREYLDWAHFEPNAATIAETTEEHGQIISGVGPIPQTTGIERQAYAHREQFVSRSDKAVRAQSVRGRMAMLGLYVGQGAPWFTDLRAELLSFPVGRHGRIFRALRQLIEAITVPHEPAANRARAVEALRHIIATPGAERKKSMERTANDAEHLIFLLRYYLDGQRRRSPNRFTEGKSLRGDAAAHAGCLSMTLNHAATFHAYYRFGACRRLDIGIDRS
jgi:hypothetical protein